MRAERPRDLPAIRRRAAVAVAPLTWRTCVALRRRRAEYSAPRRALPFASLWIKIALGKGRIVARLRVRALIGQRRGYRIETENQHGPTAIFMK